MQTVQEQLSPSDRAFVDEVVAAQAGRPGTLLGVLESVQARNRNKFLPLEILEYVAEKTGVPPSRVYSVATFYSLFNLEPQGDHTISICRGTACHTRGSRGLLQSVRFELGLAGGAGDQDVAQVTTSDRKFTVRTVACFGQCALAPVVEVDHRICGHVNERTLQREIGQLDREHE
ncbi:MAG TPA: NAD(P)H-dependent oxidoreductase subunit E [Thermoanaerobaculia bacterium]